MFWPFTLLGVVVGMLLVSIPGALLGGVLGQVLDRRLGLRSWGDLQALFARPLLADETLLFVLLGRLAKSAGAVQAAHISKARDEMQRLSMDASACRRAIEAFNQGKQGQHSVRAALKGLQRRPDVAERTLRACWRMAWADGRVAKQERELLNLWGRWLGFSVARVEQLGREYAPGQGHTPAVRTEPYQQALKLLGVSHDTDERVLKRSYRRLLSQHHPDKLVGSGASAERVRQAGQKTAELHAAYKLIRQRRGF